MICPPCRERDHLRCPEISRQNDPELSQTEKAGSTLCDCQHYEPGQLATGPERAWP